MDEIDPSGMASGLFFFFFSWSGNTTLEEVNRGDTEFYSSWNEMADLPKQTDVELNRHTKSSSAVVLNTALWGTDNTQKNTLHRYQRVLKTNAVFQQIFCLFIDGLS